MLAISIRLVVQISVLLILLFSYTTWDVYKSLSPQGCRMSWMSPSYIMQTRFDTTWSPSAKRYKLWLYREVGWDSIEDSELRKDSRPVLFIPGNAGSARQVRSIASSATRQFYESPHVISDAFSSRDVKPLDIYTVDFNEDLSAFHGTTIETQIAYTTQAISYILSLYPAGTQISILAHSMGGIVATSLLPSTNVSGIITMSTPFTLPPVRFDSRIDRLYGKLQHTLETDQTPIISLCGGARDLMISSESCILPKAQENVFRKTVFTSALEGSWSGVGHQEMVWCHQVRWRVARAVLELGQAVTDFARGQVFDKWLRDGHSLPPVPLGDEGELSPNEVSNAEVLDAGVNLRLVSPHGSKTTLLPLQLDGTANDHLQVTVLLSQGSIGGVSPQNPIPLRASIFVCDGEHLISAQCSVLKPGALRLIPNPAPGSTFPSPEDGSDESEGVVLYEAPLPSTSQESQGRWIGIKTTGGDGRGWVVAGLNRNKPITVETSTWSLLLGKVSVAIPDTQDLSIPLNFPNLLSNAMMVYSLTPHRASAPSCTDALLRPLIVHTSHQAETHYFPWHRTQNQRTLIHTHLEAPFVDSSALGKSTVNFTIQSSREETCRDDLTGFNLTVDWKATLGRWGSRYLNPLISWAAGVAAAVVFLGWNKENESMPTVEQSLDNYSHLLSRYLLPSSFLLALFPLPVSLYTGNGGQVFLSPIAPIILLVASGLVGLIWRVVRLLLMICSLMSKALCGTRKAKTSIQSGTFLSLMIICTATALLIPWQVVYVGCWLLHLYTCASSPQPSKTPSEGRSSVDIQLQARKASLSPIHLPSRNSPGVVLIKQNNLNHSLHLLLLMTWFLPLTAPVLAVWVRTLLTAGYTTPFDGDHNFLSVLPFLVLVDFASWTPGQLFERPSFEERISLKWLFAAMAASAFILGSRKPYLVLDIGRVVIWVIVACRVGRRYWGGPPWS
ncbi:GPI-inositol-deacylase [Crepidotus variabilis]|uniref:GPI inositol-deacylase n=1 Tax=Crepidotus variabilis TaxID=179855 RepID=A0A9P6EQD5_9AGAR|nr:GPI-inositol-deacylase [Crepidotus variabilis]